MNKPVKNAISLVIINDENKVLFALRSADKKSYSLSWSLPSSFVINKETYSDTIIRIGKFKLGVDLTPGKLLIKGAVDRGDFILCMHDYTATVDKNVPHIVSDDYIKMGWFNPVQKLKELKPNNIGACTSLYKEYLSRKK